MATVRASAVGSASIPAVLIVLRCVLGPVLVLLTACQAPAVLLIAVLVSAMLSDIFDGVIARRLGIATATLRVADSRADAWFFACTAVSAWIAAPYAVRSCGSLLLTTLVLQVASYMYDLVRYRRIICLHAYSAKVWGFSLYLAVAGLVAFHSPALVPLSFALGMLSFFDAAAIKMILPGWRHDVLFLGTHFTPYKLRIRPQTRRLRRN